MELNSCVAIVTGGNGGLGRRICRALALNGVHVAVVYLQSQADAQSVAEEITSLGRRAVAIQADVADASQITRMIEQTKQEFGRLDILINKPAFNQWIPFPDLEAMTLGLWNYLLHTNLTGPLQCIKAVAPIMRTQQRGRIVNIASDAGLRPFGSSIAYAVSKAGLIHLTRCMAVALAPDLLVNAVAPGFMEGIRMTSKLAPDYVAVATKLGLLKRSACKDDVADQVMTLVRTDSTTGQVVTVDAGRI